MGVKLLLKIKASEMSDLGFHCSAARGGLHSRTGSWVRCQGQAVGTLALWQLSRRALRPSLDTLARDRHDKPFGNEKRKGCLQPGEPLNESENETLGVLLRHFCAICLLGCFDLHLHGGHLGVQARSCVAGQMIIFMSSQCATRMLFLLFFFPLKRLLREPLVTDVTLPLCFDVLGWTLLSPVFLSET